MSTKHGSLLPTPVFREQQPDFLPVLAMAVERREVTRINQVAHRLESARITEERAR